MCKEMLESNLGHRDAADACAYFVVLSHGGAETAVARCDSPTIAYAAYYAAQREHYGRNLTLRRGDHVLATSPTHSRLSSARA